MNFMFYDLIFLFVFIVFLSVFLYSKRKNLKKEGLLILYRTNWGIKLIDYVGEKYKKTITVLSYISITLGYILMASVLYLLGKVIYVYVAFPQIVRDVKIPPIMPLIPYLPQMFKLDFLPPFYFTYWIFILAIIAITHEFAHGIFARCFDIRVKKTGFGFFPFFLPVFLAAFVELDEEKMIKKKKFPQLAILSAGTFANILTAIFFFLVMFLFFSVAFTPSGVQFDVYPYSILNISMISSVNSINLENPTYDNLLSSLNGSGYNEIKIKNRTYLSTREFLQEQEDNQGFVVLYYDGPAIRNNLQGAIIEINNVKITSKEDLVDKLDKHLPGDKINISTNIDGEIKKYEITLDENPENNVYPWLGIGFIDKSQSGFFGKIYSTLSSFKQDNIYYEPKAGEITLFIYNLLWWIILISISVALVNMLPVGIFDGGRVFYLSVLYFVKSERVAKKIFSYVTYLFLILVLVMMLSWAFSIF